MAPEVAQFFSLHVFDSVKSPYNTVSQSSKTLGRTYFKQSKTVALSLSELDPKEREDRSSQVFGLKEP